MKLVEAFVGDLYTNICLSVRVTSFSSLSHKNDFSAECARQFLKKRSSDKQNLKLKFGLTIVLWAFSMLLLIPREYMSKDA